MGRANESFRNREWEVPDAGLARVTLLLDIRNLVTWSVQLDLRLQCRARELMLGRVQTVACELRRMVIFVAEGRCTNTQRRKETFRGCNTEDRIG